MFIIKTTQSTPEGLQDKFVSEITDGKPQYTSKREMAQQFTKEQAHAELITLHQNFGKTFTTEEV